MAIQYLKFRKEASIDFSELFDDKTIIVSAYSEGYRINVTLDKQNIHELIIWLTTQLDGVKSVNNTKKK